MRTVEQIEQSAIDALTAKATPELVTIWEDTDRQMDAMLGTKSEGQIERYQHMATVRGWIMDELERRDANAFATWMDSASGTPRPFYA